MLVTACANLGARDFGVSDRGGSTLSEQTTGDSQLWSDMVAARAVRSRRVAEAHFTFEQTNDPDEIMLSMKSYDPLHTAVVLDGPGGSDELVLNRTTVEQRDFYVRSRESGNFVAAEVFTSIGSDWYGFVHLIVTGEAISSGERGDMEVIGLLPSTIDEDTIAGEMGWTRPASARPLGPGVPYHRVAIAHVHAQWLDLVRGMDARGLSELYSDNVFGALRDYPADQHAPLTGRTAVQDHYASLFLRYRIIDLDVVLRLVEDWYLLAELRWELEDGDRNRFVHRTADIMVLDDEHRIRRHIGYGTDFHPLD